jgi:hypothetical protein
MHEQLTVNYGKLNFSKKQIEEKILIVAVKSIYTRVL